MTLKKGSLSIDEYLQKLKQTSDNLAAIGKAVLDTDKVFQVAHGLGKKYQDFRLTMLTKLSANSGLLYKDMNKLSMLKMRNKSNT